MKKNYKSYYLYGLCFFFILMIIFSNNSQNNYVEVNDEPSNEDDQVIQVNTKIGVDLKGSIVNPGYYELDENSRINDLIILSGGFINANESCINLAQHLYDGQTIFVPEINAACESSTLININNANVEQLQLIKGIGPGKADAIVKHRETNGMFSKKEDIKNVSGIGDSTFEKIKDQITI